MSSIILTGDTSGTLTVSAPLVAGTNTLTLAAATGTLSPLVSATAVTASGTSVDFTGIPSYAKRITVMLNGVSTSGTSNLQIQIGSGSFTTSGYSGSGVPFGGTVSSVTSGFSVSTSVNATDTYTGSCIVSNVTSNTWQGVGQFANVSNSGFRFGSGFLALGGTLDRIRITTVNGTDTFDAGTINIIYEG
jgi:hypothetical protein